ncbi:uncharacterized protein BDR25DRAFT_283666 [Lindgomyces ingoldianus]|uniref:Uncharacterized protein n=1 Tax=Lindgomyces ingoldianus TaxID=673940 RepID=A0ACB6R3B7_9PLEO|nr:uncharacterized protein BDR25DRAFT_283666 [Lindgomyces ingoldianus]KAF2473007.1 hypothetical protein BDR25DRAFT_283666 [Lindgomyces ingoldianus]
MDSKYTDRDDLSSEGDYEKTAFLNNHYIKEAKTKRGMLWITLFNLFLFTISIMILICAIFSQSTTYIHSAAKLMDDFDIYSPAAHVVEYHHVKFEFPNPLNASKYVGITDDVDNAWMDIAYLPDQMVRVEDMAKLQKPLDSMKVTDPKTGEGGYRVGLEVFHQLHCLNLLRMSTYPDYYTKLWWSDTNDKPEKVRMHLDHCIEILRENLMCQADVNVFTFHEKPGLEGFWPDYEQHHACRNFDQIRQWALDNAMPYADV